MIKNKFLYKISPGIRTKLSFFTAILVVAILALTSVIYYGQQKKALEEKIDSELRAPLEYINTVVLDLEKLSRSLILIEEFKIRIKEKQAQLSKFKRKVTQKETGFFGTLKSIGASLGLKVKYDYKVRAVDTYYTRYLSPKEIQDFESKVKNELRKENGAPIEQLTYSKLTTIAKKTAEARLAAESFKIRLGEIDEESKAAAEELSSKDLDPKRTKELETLKGNLEKERKLSEKSLQDSERKVLAGEANMVRSLQNFFKGSYKDRISSLGLLPDKIRILAFNRTGKQTLDTGLLFPQSSSTGKKLFGFSEFEKNKDELFQRDKLLISLQEKTDAENYEIAGRQYEVVSRSVFRNLNTAERAKILTKEIQNDDWEDFLSRDREVSKEISNLTEKLKVKLDELKKTGKLKPSADPEFRGLYSEYKRILKKRETFLYELSPYISLKKENANQWKKEKDELEEKLKNLSAELSQLQKQLKGSKPKENSELSAEEIQEKIRALEFQSEEIRDSLQSMILTKDDWTQYDENKSEDAFFGLREAALDDFAFLPYKTDSSSIKRYWKSPEERKQIRAKWKILRDWIMAGESETEIPKQTKNAALNAGILVRSRSEVEELMWNLDSTPFVIDHEQEKGLVFDLLNKDHLGYNLIILDRTDGLREIKRNREELLQYTAVIGTFAILLAYGLAWVVVRRIKAIIKKSEEVGEGNLKVEFPLSGYDEIGVLSESLNNMVTGLREREELRGELIAAEEIQKRLLPDKFPTNLNGRVEFGAFYKAMAGVGGDYYDFIELEKGKVALCIGDVSNHGVGPAIVMALFRSQVRSILRKGERDLKKVLLELNGYLYEDTPDHMFITFFLGIFDSNTSRFDFISAGHVKPLLFDSSERKLMELPAGGSPIGMDDNDFFATTIQAKTVKLESGDFFFQYTDGLDEARSPDGGLYGKERLHKIVGKSLGKSPQDLISAIVTDVESFTNKEIGKPGLSDLTDDIAMIAIRCR
ncbi:guanylate cyclase [Leptospira perolatii]|uniref:Guanylate cyclase n=1 Tax=Leptospira perolatii TaxID=2023191 RepID=A0A2M9ZI69_9LEPT|nr:SpoIIE family protein phosphatase [Leptospira perolatii]PJZ68027.1 guanylate cyclase [Leptospira perolatii]PJZ71664.1 guanylate cyclase [Leptospira perolatii]